MLLTASHQICLSMLISCGKDSPSSGTCPSNLGSHDSGSRNASRVQSHSLVQTLYHSINLPLFLISPRMQLQMQLRLSQRDTFKSISLMASLHPRRHSVPLYRPDGHIRVGRRLENFDLPYRVKHPILLHISSVPVQVYSARAHVTSRNTEPSTLQAIISSDSHIIRLRCYLKSLSRKLWQNADTTHAIRQNTSRATISCYRSRLCWTIRGNPRKPTLEKAYTSVSQQRLCTSNLHQSVYQYLLGILPTVRQTKGPTSTHLL